MADLTPLRFGRAQDKGNGENPVPSSPMPVQQEHSPGWGEAQQSGATSA